jgi:hypothetical protein
MPRYYLQIASGTNSGASSDVFDVADKNAAWAEMTRVCGDLVGDVVLALEQNAVWQLELTDERRKPLFRIRLAAETLEKLAATSNVREPSYP